ncbi:MAG TPA: hypothetical protein VJ599_03435 [Nitrososphaeraceae archaeon]|nr:hypothetical protein [Nitrososphaeraceae archaeon]
MNNCYDGHFRISDLEVIIEREPIDGNAQFEVVAKGNHLIMGVEDALQNKISGAWH